MPDGGAGLYWVVFNITDMTYSTVKIGSMGTIGSFSEDNDWGTDAFQLTPSADLKTWSGDVTFATAGVQWKVRTNNAWDNNPNLGATGDTEPVEFATGTPFEVVNNGKNLTNPEAGTYTVTVDLAKVPYTMTIVKK